MRGSRLPTPNSPEPLKPQHLSPPVLTIAHTDDLPTATLAAPLVSPLTSTGRLPSVSTRPTRSAQHVYTAREYTQTFPEMRGGDIFMGAFSAEQVMYNHFGYRTPMGRLYMAGSATHPGGAISGGGGYISAGVLARDLGLKLWWKPWDASGTLGALSASA